MYDGKVLCAQRSLVKVYADCPTPKTPRSCYAVIRESKMDYFVVHMLFNKEVANV